LVASIVYMYFLALAMQMSSVAAIIQSTCSSYTVCVSVCVHALCSTPSTSIYELCGDIRDLVAHLGAAVCKANKMYGLGQS
jgi:hypothetical protein